MEFTERHTWCLSTAEARWLQESLAGEVDTSAPIGPYQTIAGADVSYNKFDTRLFAAVVVLNAKTGEVIERVSVLSEARFPYVPGLLSFREAPAVLEAFRKVKTRPDVVVYDGQGFAHPRRIGIASHLGLWLGVPTIGCAKSRLCGEFDEPGPNRGDRSSLVDRGETIGSVLRTRAWVKPLYISSGHLCDLESAVSVVLANAPRYRLPLATRLAHDEVNALRRSAGPRPGARG